MCLVMIEMSLIHIEVSLSDLYKNFCCLNPVTLIQL
jgi:hypothetical protein